MNIMARILLVLSICSTSRCMQPNNDSGDANLNLQPTQECSSMPTLDADRVEKIRSKYSLPALGAASLKQGCLAFLGASGLRRLGATEEVRPTDSWHLGSNTKAMTAALIAMLIEEKRFQWNTPMVALLNDIEVHPSYRQATVEMLLAHHGGIPEDLIRFEQGKLFDEISNPHLDLRKGRRLVSERIFAVPAESEPGSHYAYANAGYIILGHLIERVSGEAWEDVVRKRLFTPLGMNSCRFGSFQPEDPWGHRIGADGHSLIPVAPGFAADNPPVLGPAGTVRCTLQDYAKFLQWNLEGLRGHASLLSADTFKKLHQPFASSNPYSRGGWQVLSREWAQGTASTHTGSNTMNYANAWIAPQLNQAWIAVSNAGSDEAWKATNEMIGEMLRD